MEVFDKSQLKKNLCIIYRIWETCSLLWRQINDISSFKGLLDGLINYWPEGSIQRKKKKEKKNIGSTMYRNAANWQLQGSNGRPISRYYCVPVQKCGNYIAALTISYLCLFTFFRGFLTSCPPSRPPGSDSRPPPRPQAARRVDIWTKSLCGHFNRQRTLRPIVELSSLNKVSVVVWRVPWYVSF